MDVGSRHETPGSEARDFITHSNSSRSWVIHVLCQSPKLCSQGGCGEDQVAPALTVGCIAACIWATIYFTMSSEPIASISRVNHYLSLSQGCQQIRSLLCREVLSLFPKVVHYTNTLENSREQRQLCLCSVWEIHGKLPLKSELPFPLMLWVNQQGSETINGSKFK